jgi:hypothetical protein
MVCCSGKLMPGAVVALKIEVEATTMQVVFYRQNYGELALGLSDIDMPIGKRRESLEKEDVPPWRKKEFFEISSGGVTDPWSDRRRYSQTRIAIVGEELVYYAYGDDDGEEGEAKVYAKAEYEEYEFYLLYYRSATSIISHGLRDPEVMWDGISEAVIHHHKKLKCDSDEFCPCCEWRVIKKRMVPRRFRSLLGKVMSRVQDSIQQGPEFFRNPKAR